MAGRPDRSAWGGSIQFGGFPIHLRAYKLVESRSAKSFKGLCACHQQPVAMPKRCAVDDTPLGPDQILKGHQTGKDQYAVLPADAVEQLRTAEATLLLEIEQLAPVASIRPYLGLTTGAYRLVPDDKIPGSEQPVQILWNGLMASDRAVITEWVMRAGSRDTLLVITADAFGLTGNTLPYASELKQPPEFKPVENEAAAAMFEQFAGVQGIDMDDFRFQSYESQYEKRRDAAIAAALDGKPIAAPAAKAAPAGTVDLMAAMQAAMDAKAKKPKAKAAKPTKKVAA